MTRHSFLIILRFNKDDDQNPLRCGVIDQSGKFKQMAHGHASLVVGIVDPSMRSAMTPMMMIPLTGPTWRLYNKVLKAVEDLNGLYRGANGYLRDPTSLNNAQSRLVLRSIENVGHTIFDMLKSSDDSAAVCNWLDSLFRDYERRGPAAEETAHHVTIVTNDFSIPWYWLVAHDLFLCEIVALGVLQLSSYYAGYRGAADPAGLAKVARENLFKALLINGSPDLPFARAELDAVMAGLAGNASDSDGVSRVASQEVSTKRMLKDLWNNTKLGERVEQYRVVHFTGHYSSGTLMIGDEEIEANEELDQFVDHSVLVLDGCSSSEGLKAWTDMDTVTARLIHAGAIGCVVTALPLKNDPLITEWFWKAFYEKLRIKGTSVGQALLHARAVLKDRLEEQDVSNPAWLYYQLVVNPTVDLFAESVEWAGPR